MAGEGTVDSGVVNPWAQYGLNADGTPIVAKPVEPVKADPIQAEVAELKTKLAAAEEKLSKVPTDFEGMNKKMEIVDRLVKAFAGEDLDPKTAQYRKIWSEMKDVAKTAAPGFYKQMERYEKDPDAGDATERTANALAQARLADLNTSAHTEVMGLAKSVFRGLSQAELAEAVYPFESTMTEMINANPELSRRFVNGDMSIVRELFQRLAKPHLAGRLRQKQAATAESRFPKAVPKSAGAPQAGEGDGKPQRNLSTRQGREQFHKQAVGRFFERATTNDDT